MEVPIRSITDSLYNHIEALEKRVAVIEKQLIESCIGGIVEGELRQVPVTTVGVSCRYLRLNEFGIFVETCLRDASSLIGGKAYCTYHATKIMVTEDMVDRHAARVRADDARAKQGPQKLVYDMNEMNEKEKGG